MTIDRRAHGGDHGHALTFSDDPSLIERLAEAGPISPTDPHVGRMPL